MRGLLTVVTTTFCLLPGILLADDSSRIGRKVEPFQLHDFQGAEINSTSWNDRKLVVVAFLGTECPLAKLYGPRLAELEKRYKDKNVQFVAIDSNEQDTLAEISQYARVSKIEFPFLKDPSNLVADRFGAKRTPEVFVLDHEQKVRYHGRIDDQFGIGYSRNDAKTEFLCDAIDQLLAGKPVKTSTTDAIGCHIGRVPHVTPKGEITFAKDIAPIVQNHCVGCHRPGEIGPFTLTSPEDVVNWSSTIREVVQEKRMPPWHADSDVGKFVNDRRLSEREKKLLFDWMDNGMPVGNLADLPAPRQFTEGWQIATPDLVLSMPQPFNVPAKGTVEYQYFPIQADLSEDKWIIASEARPGNRAVVHHLILFYVPPNFDRPMEDATLRNSIATFAPGVPAWQAPEGMARRIPAGSKLYLQAHYTPNGVETTDQSRMGFVFGDPKNIQKQLLTEAAVNFQLKIPPRKDNVLVKEDFVFRRDMRLVSMLPHMHLRGKAFKIESIEPKGKKTLLLNVPRYDFNWQNTYVFNEPLPFSQETKLLCSAWYDNSEKNPSNPDPSATVRWGDQTWQEMLVAQFEMVLEEQDLRLGLPVVRKLDSGEFETTFKYRPSINAKAVYLAGEFNAWKPTDLKMEGPDADGNYVTKVKLKPGIHEYKFVIDGKIWRNDPGNPDVMGKYANSVIRIDGRLAAIPSPKQ